jgi:hypothetical protein
MAGALTPYWVDGWTVHHYKFTAASGAEYRLDRNSGGVWTSSESGVYLEYDANTKRLYFQDGTFWLMGAESSEEEADAGTLYPTVAEDPNGNQITFVYKAGMYAASGDSSARIKYVADVRAVPTDVCFSESDVCTPFTGEGIVNLPATYVLSHTSEGHYVEGVPVVTVQFRSIRNTIGTAESYGFQYAWQPVASPFSPYASFGTAVMLSTVQHEAIGKWQTFTYVPAGGATTGELEKVTFPYGGTLRWSYSDVAYPAGRLQREVSGRWAAYKAGAPEKAIAITWDPDTTRPFHGWAKLTDPGPGQKQWTFDAAGRMAGYAERAADGQPDLLRKTMTWAADSVGRAYVSSVVTEHDPGTTSAKSQKTEQWLDDWGNVTVSKVYDFGQTSNPRTYTQTYLTDAQYAAKRIRNRLVTSTVSRGAETIPLVTNYWDKAAGRVSGGAPLLLR